MSMRRQKFLLFRVYRFQDSEAYGILYDKHYEKIHRFVHFKLPRIEDVDEVTSEVFLRGWEYATSTRVENAPALFYTIARRAIADYYRKRADEISLDAAVNVASDDNPLEDAVGGEESEKLLNLLKQLRNEYQEVLIMRHLDEMNIREIAAALEKTPNNVRVLLHRAKKALESIAK